MQKSEQNVFLEFMRVYAMWKCMKMLKARFEKASFEDVCFKQAMLRFVVLFAKNHLRQDMPSPGWS